MSGGCFPTSGATIPVRPPSSTLTLKRFAARFESALKIATLSPGVMTSFTSLGSGVAASIDTVVLGVSDPMFLIRVVKIPLAISTGSTSFMVAVFSLPFSV